MVETHGPAAVDFGLAGEQVWRQIAKRSFAVLSYVTPAGEPRSSGVVYTAARHRLYVAVAPESWKALHIPATGRVAVTIPVRRGGLLSLLLPIPPATISFHARAVVHPRGSLADGSPASELAALMPAERLANCRIVEIFPEGYFLTYGIGTSLRAMRDPAVARGRVPTT
ncbi:pyridoxamine 5'-phosphate oxidase [Kribbella orskensis]|uniref:Pyridoxamine 5'-phosphate oxidase n=1 Tax=Kribbella orskensis TaxID=2512216 RepID=A0ABY2BB06_9ACTN|nr:MULTISPECIES: pyridoxamine 5'-phosphate oxidase family protein [Kribbella]TCN33399.1 pyridoxamine 5'-phosphate oxidase [Kribbella sp. VKM Ac-2500]TCO13545.1 pyridoxamine 5'-phosphate oxidase [Kribbella orskensis]